jgi:hypothetical protein
LIPVEIAAARRMFTNRRSPFILQKSLKRHHSTAFCTYLMEVLEILQGNKLLHFFGNKVAFTNSDFFLWVEWIVLFHWAWAWA